MAGLPITGEIDASTAKALTRLQTAAESGSYYEGQQVIKSVYHRSRTRKQIEQSYQLLEGGARIQLRAGQTTCGLELGQMLIDAYVADGVPPEGALLSRVEGIMGDFEAVPQEDDNAALAGEMSVMDQYLTLGKKVLKWVLKHNKAAAGSIYDRIAAYITATRGCTAVALATPYYVRGSSMKQFAQALRELANHCQADEEQLILLRAFLQLLLIAGSSKTAQEAQIRRAQELLESYDATASEKLQQAPGHTFICLLLLALTPGKSSLPLLRNVRNLYAPLLLCDKALLELLDKVEGMYFGTGGGGPLGGMLGNMFKSLMMGDDDA